MKVFEEKRVNRYTGTTHYEGCWEIGGPAHMNCQEAQAISRGYAEQQYPPPAATPFEATPPSGKAPE